MSYKALYRIYRPQDFNEVAGQTHITTTLKNALMNDQVAHAYLFSGPRGTGKTSIAKIFAKAVNCEHAPVENPCNKCDNCIGIQNGTISDVIEIDAASNNGVDEIREIRDKVKYLPGYVKYKVYIIDEVHMLSTGAFNALLKTLEEPPQHVIFILCTTEPQKIPLTIHSRCQRFDFKAITTKDIISKLKEIIEQEKIIIDEAAINKIAIHSEGGLRDAISLLDQARSYSPEHISVNDVNQISGELSIDMQLDLAEALIRGNSTKSIEVLNDLITEGKEVRKINVNLIEFFRDILMKKNLRNLDESNYLYKNERFIELSKMVSNNLTFYILDILNKAANDIKWSNSPKIYLELAFIKITDNEMSSPTKIFSILDDLDQRLTEIEKIKNDINKINEKKSENLISEIVDKDLKQAEKDILSDVSVDETPMEIIEEGPRETETPILPGNPQERNITSIEFVENILNNGDREDKNILINKWSQLTRLAKTEEEKYVAKLLLTGQIVASNYNDIIITYQSLSVCNTLMKLSNKLIANNLLQKNYNRELNFIALQEDSFSKIVNEFRNLWKANKNQYIKLSGTGFDETINKTDVKKISTSESQPNIIKDALDLFGDIVKIKK